MTWHKELIRSKTVVDKETSSLKEALNQGLSEKACDWKEQVILHKENGKFKGPEGVVFQEKGFRHAR